MREPCTARKDAQVPGLQREAWSYAPFSPEPSRTTARYRRAFHQEAGLNGFGSCLALTDVDAWYILSLQCVFTRMGVFHILASAFTE